MSNDEIPTGYLELSKEYRLRFPGEPEPSRPWGWWACKEFDLIEEYQRCLREGKPFDPRAPHLPWVKAGLFEDYPEDLEAAGVVY